MSLAALLRSLWSPRRLDWPDPVPRRPAPRPRPRRSSPIVLGGRVRLRVPLASSHTVWIPEGAVGVVVGGYPKKRQVSIELDTPRTVITVPWDWVEDEPEPPAPAESPPAPA